jgi:stage III sporulation protein AG
MGKEERGVDGTWRDWLSRLWRQDRSLVVRLVVIGLLGVALVAIGSVAHPPGGSYTPAVPSPAGNASGGDVLEQEEAAMDSQLAAMVSAIPGAGRVTATVTLARSATTQYAGGSSSRPLAESQPAVLGVVVVASGAANPTVRQEITDAVETLLQIQPYQVLVLPNEGGS